MMPPRKGRLVAGQRPNKPIRPTVVATERDRAWAAGLFEGEGTITIGKRGQDDTYRLVVVIGNTDMEILTFFHVRWGGSIGAHSPRPRRKQAWQWVAAFTAAEQFLNDVGPFFVTRRVREKMELGLIFRQHQANRTDQRWHANPEYKLKQRLLYDRMKVMNRRGSLDGAQAS